MRITFHPSFDSAASPGPTPQPGTAKFGAPWLGTMGLLGLLETQLGLGGLIPSLYERAAALVPHLRENQGNWRSSFDKSDALGVAQRLIKERDFLMDYGWNGEPVHGEIPVRPPPAAQTARGDVAAT